MQQAAFSGQVKIPSLKAAPDPADESVAITAGIALIFSSLLGILYGRCIVSQVIRRLP